LFLPRHRPVACGGDVLVRIAPREDTGPATVVARVQVRTVAAGSVVRVAGRDLDRLDLWPEIVRIPVVFALGAMRELQDHGADVGPRDEGDLVVAAGSVTAPFPGLPAQVNLRGQPRARGTGGGRRYGPDTAVTAAPPVALDAPAWPRCRPDRAISCGGPRAAVGRGRDGGGIDQQPERGCGLLRDDAVADDPELVGPGDAGHPGDQAGDAHHPLGELG